ncbi:MAG: cyclophilin-like fold protein [Brevinema sp.]
MRKFIIILAITISNTLQAREKSMILAINDTSFSVTLEDSASTQALEALLPLTITMKDLHQNEKYYYFSQNLPVSPQAVNTVSTGDVMLYGNNCIVIFYESFATSYRYTRLGKIKNTSGLKKALGAGDITVKFSLLP